MHDVLRDGLLCVGSVNNIGVLRGNLLVDGGSPSAPAAGTDAGDDAQEDADVNEPHPPDGGVEDAGDVFSANVAAHILVAVIVAIVFGEVGSGGLHAALETVGTTFVDVTGVEVRIAHFIYYLKIIS